MNDGSEFEVLSTKVVRALNPDKQVTHDVKILGKLTEVQRQIDVKLDENEYDFVVYECKDWKSTVGIDVIQKLIGDLEDVGAKRGAVIANSPFTKGAMNLAAKKGVDLLNLVKTDSPVSKIGIAAEVLAKVKIIDAMQFSVNDLRIDRGPVYSIDPDKFILVHEGKQLSVREYVKVVWNEGLNTTAAIGINTIEIPDAKIIDINGEPFTVTCVTINIYAAEAFQEGRWVIEEASGLYNAKDHTFHAYGNMKSAVLSVQQMEKEFAEVTAEQASRKQYSIILEIGTEYK